MTVVEAIWRRLSARADSEHRQALIRLLFIVVIGAALAAVERTLPEIPGFGVNPSGLGFVVLLALAYAALLLAWIVIDPGVHRLRRIVGIFCDNAIITAIMAFGGPDTSILYTGYLCIMLCNGVRFGTRYLLAAVALSSAGFALVIWVSPVWSAHPVFAVSLLLGQAAAAIYATTLVGGLYGELGQARLANVAKRRFLSTVSHELRAPLNAVVGMAELLADQGAKPRDTPALARAMQHTCATMLGLVDDVLDLSCIEAGKLAVERRSFDLYALIGSVALATSTQAEAKGLLFDLALDSSVPPVLVGDAARVRQVLANLLGNALKFTTRGGIRLRVLRERTPARDASLERTSARLCFEVEDTGSGIPEHEVSAVFESFSRLEQAASAPHTGGLGLAIVQDVARAMGGRVDCRARHGGGTVFRFRLPFELGTYGELGRAAADSFEERVLGMRVLAVGFEPAELDALGADAAKLGASVFASSSIEAALDTGNTDFKTPGYELFLLHEDVGKKEIEKLLVKYASRPYSTRAYLVLGVSSPPRLDAEEMLSSGFCSIVTAPIEFWALQNVLHAAAATLAAARGAESLSSYGERVLGAAARDVGAHHSEPLRVLLADDNDIGALITRKILERAGMQVTAPGNGQEALDALCSSRFDVALLDLNMPDMGGLQVLRAYNGATPVAIMSADARPDTMMQCEAAGAATFISKPVEPRKLITLVTRVARRARPSAAGESSSAPGGAPEPAEAPVYSTQALEELRQIGGPDSTFMLQILVGFSNDNDYLVGQMRQALAGGDMKRFRELAHDIRGSALSVGALALARLCAHVETLPEAQLEHAGDDYLEALWVELCKAKQWLGSSISQQQRARTAPTPGEAVSA